MWEPAKTFTWLGISVNLNKGCLYVSEERISNLRETIEYIKNDPYISARTLAKLAGKLISTEFVLEDITQLKTRFIYQCIESEPLGTKSLISTITTEWLRRFYARNLT